MKKRFLAMFCCCVLLLGFVMPPERAHAVALVDDVVIAAAVFVAGCGLTWVVTHTDGEGFTAKVGSLLNEYLNTNFAGQSISDWIGDVIFSAHAGVLFFPKFAVSKFAAFTNWLIQTKGIVAGSTTSLGSSVTAVTVDGQSFTVTKGVYHSGYFEGSDFTLGTPITTIAVSPSDATIYDFGTEKIRLSLNEASANHILILQVYRNGNWRPSYSMSFPVGAQLYICRTPSYPANQAFIGVYDPTSKNVQLGYSEYFLINSYTSDVSIVPSAINVPDAGTLEDGQALGIDTGTNAADMAEVKTLVGEAAAAGEVSATVTGATVIPGTVVDVDSLGLPNIALVITQKFPFSIPWDIARGIELLAAPPEAPRWQVDFMAPLAYRVGAWEGDTTVTFDMAEYPLVGQVCRWVFTIGFCLLLAAATKKLAWVA